MLNSLKDYARKINRGIDALLVSSNLAGPRVEEKHQGWVGFVIKVAVWYGHFIVASYIIPPLVLRHLVRMVEPLTNAGIGVSIAVFLGIVVGGGLFLLAGMAAGALRDNKERYGNYF